MKKKSSFVLTGLLLLVACGFILIKEVFAWPAGCASCATSGSWCIEPGTGYRCTDNPETYCYTDPDGTVPGKACYSCTGCSGCPSDYWPEWVAGSMVCCAMDPPQRYAGPQQGGSCPAGFLCSYYFAKNSTTCANNCIFIEGPSSSPSPSPSPSASPSPSPSPSPTSTQLTFMCGGLERDPIAELNIGDQVKFTCSYEGTATFNHYDYRIRRPSDDSGWHYPSTWQGIVGATPYFAIEEAGDHLVQCRSCTDSTSDYCTDWGQAGGWQE